MPGTITQDAPLLDQVSETPEPNKALTVVPAETVTMFERLAKDPDVSVEKLRELVALQEHVMARQAEEAFWVAFAAMQGELPTINEDGAIVVDSVVRSRYSTNEAIQEAIRPILQKHGFSLSFRNETKDANVVRVTGILAHRLGHKERDTFESKPDDGGKMNSIQRIGSTRSYGARYTTISLLNIVSRAKADRDDDGEAAGQKEAPQPPNGFDKWWSDMKAAAEKGAKALDATWGASRGEFKNYVHKYLKKEHAALKERAMEIGQ